MILAYVVLVLMLSITVFSTVNAVKHFKEVRD